MGGNVFAIKAGSTGDWIFIRMGMDLTGATIPRVAMRNRLTGAVKIAAGIAHIANGTYVINGVSTVLSPASGVILYPWQAGDIDTPAAYDFQASVLTAQGAVIRPASGFAVVEVEGAIP